VDDIRLLDETYAWIRAQGLRVRRLRVGSIELELSTDAPESTARSPVVIPAPDPVEAPPPEDPEMEYYETLLYSSGADPKEFIQLRRVTS